MKKIALLVFIALPLEAHAFTAAQTVKLLEKEIDAFDIVINQMKEEQSQDAYDMRIQEATELFPIFPEDNPFPTRDLLRERSTADVRTAPYLTFSYEGQKLTFFDVKKGTWFEPYIRYVGERGIVSGLKDVHGQLLQQYNPQGFVRIDELAKISVITGRINPDSCEEEPQNSSASGSAIKQYVSCAESNGFTIFSDASVNVRRPALRKEVIVTILQALGVNPVGGSSEVFASGFIDVNSSTEFARFIEHARVNGVITGYTDELGKPTGEFGPDDRVTRAEIAKIVSLAMQVYGEG